MEESWLNKEFVDYYNQNYATTEEEFATYHRFLNISAQDTVLDLGCGNGEFLALCPRETHGFGLDISPHQIEQARKLLANHSNINLICQDFVEGVKQMAAHPNFRPLTKVFSRKALHHLEDEQKSAMLDILAPLLAPQAQLYIEDGIYYSFPVSQIKERWDELMEDGAAYYGASWPDKRHDLEHTILTEHPTGIDFWQTELARHGVTVQALYPRCSFFGGFSARKGLAATDHVPTLPWPPKP